MKFSLVNPKWDFTGSTYFGCRDPHLPLELMFARDQILAAGHEAELLDAHMNNFSLDQVRYKVEAFEPDFLVVPTAPTYLFWRCPPPELRIPMEWIQALGAESVKVIIGPHASATPAAAPMPAHKNPVTTNPGTRKSTYGGPPALIAPPKI